MACRRCTLHRGSRRCVAQRRPRGHPAKRPSKASKITGYRPSSTSLGGSSLPTITTAGNCPVQVRLGTSGVLAASLSESSPASRRTAALADRPKATAWLAQSSTVHEAARSMPQGACPASSSTTPRYDVFCMTEVKVTTEHPALCSGVLRTGKEALLNSSGAA